MSLPLLFTPVSYRVDLLIDGGTLTPVPIALAFNDDTDLTIAVNLGGVIENYLVKATNDQVEDEKWN